MELKMPRSTYEEVDYLAERRGTTRSQYIRKCVDAMVTAEFRAIVRDDPDLAARLGLSGP